MTLQLESPLGFNRYLLQSTRFQNNKPTIIRSAGCYGATQGWDFEPLRGFAEWLVETPLEEQWALLKPRTIPNLK